MARADKTIHIEITPKPEQIAQDIRRAVAEELRAMADELDPPYPVHGIGN